MVLGSVVEGWQSTRGLSICVEGYGLYVLGVTGFEGVGMGCFLGKMYCYVCIAG